MVILIAGDKSTQEQDIRQASELRPDSELTQIEESQLSPEPANAS